MAGPALCWNCFRFFMRNPPRVGTALMLANVADDADCTQLRFSVRLRLALIHCWCSLPCGRSIQNGFVGLVKLRTFAENMFQGWSPSFPLDSLLVTSRVQSFVICLRYSQSFRSESVWVQRIFLFISPPHFDFAVAVLQRLKLRRAL